ncbi:MAG: tyrosine-type recombinase/integrase [Actinomycetota bacterium]
MSHIQRRGKSRWRARYIGPDGRERSRTFERRVDAERFLAGVDTDIARGGWVDPKLGKVTFGAWAQQWQSTVVHLKPKTRHGYDSLLRSALLPEFGATPLAAISTLRVRGWVAEMTRRGVSSSRVRQSYGLLSMVLKSAVESEYLVKSPCIGIRIARVPKREAVVLTEEQLEAVSKGIPQAEYRVLINVLAYGGIRWGEACALRRRRCDLSRCRIEVAESLAEISGQFEFGEPKTYARRWVRLPRFVAEMLERHLSKDVRTDPDALVFTAGGGTLLRNSNFRRRVWEPALKRAELPHATLHDLRHTCASLLIRRGASIKAVQQQLGHSTPMVTLNVYAHLFEDDLDRLYEGLDAPWSERQTASRRPEGLSADGPGAGDGGKTGL